MVYDAVMSDT